MGQRRRRNVDRAEEDCLAKKLFGLSAGFLEEYDEYGTDNENEEQEEALVVQDRLGKAPVWHDEDDETEEAVVDVPMHPKKMHIRKATDTTDQKITPKEYEQRLRDTFCRSKPSWAQQLKVSDQIRTDHSDTDDNDLEVALHEMTASTGNFVARSTSLPKGIIDLKRLSNITLGYRSEKKPIRALQFHPTRQVLMCAGENCHVSLFEIGVPETKEAFLQDVRFKAFPITSAAFTADGFKIIVGSRKKESLFCYDLLDGKVTQMRTPYEMTRMNAGHFCLSFDGKYIAVLARNEIHILTAVSMEYLGVFTAPAKIASVQFSPNNSAVLYAIGRNGQVFIWNMKIPKEYQTFYDEGAVKGTVIRISGNGQNLACGSNTGIVNLYNTEDLKDSFPKPVKVFDNLTTSIDCIAFNGDSQIFSVSSSVKNNAFRLMHTGSRTVYENVPPKGINLGKVTVTDFSPKSAYMAVGDDRGFLSLFRLQHFNNY